MPVRPPLLCGCEILSLRDEDIRGSEVFDHWCPRTLLKVSYHDRISDETIGNRCIFACFSWRIQIYRLHLFEHVFRKSDQDLITIILASSSCADRQHQRVGQPKTWPDIIFDDITQRKFGCCSAHASGNWIRSISVKSFLLTAKDGQMWSNSHQTDSSFSMSYP